MSTTDRSDTTDADAAPAAGPAVLRVEVADLDRAAGLYGVLGGAEVDAAGVGRRWSLPPGLTIEATVGPRPGPRAVLVAVDDLSGLAARAAELAVATAERGSELVVTDPRVGGGELVFVPTDALDLPATAARPTAAGNRLGLEGFDHVCLAVPDLELSAALIHAAGGIALIGGDSPLGGRVLQFGFPRHKLELMAPTGPGPITQFLDRRQGRAGIQHATLMVRDVLVAVAALDRAGLDTIGTDTTTQPAWHETYIRPRAADRLLLQLAATTNHIRGTLTPEQVSDVIAGRYIAHDYAMRHLEEVAT